MTRALAFGAFLASVSSAGCSLPKCCFVVPVEGDGTTHYVVIGVGIVSTAGGEQAGDVMVTKVQSLGATVSNQPGLSFNLGAASSRAVLVPDGSEDVRIEVSDAIGGPLRINAQRVDTSAGIDGSSCNTRPTDNEGGP